MTLVSLPSPIAWPGICGHNGGGPFLTGALTVSAAGHYFAEIFVARENMTISHVGVRAGAASGSPTIEVRIETVDASGLPSGTLWATNTNGTTGTVTSNSDILQALTASASITKGQVFCVKIAYASGTSLSIVWIGNISLLQGSNIPYVVNNTGTPTKAVLSTNLPTIALGSSSTTFYQLPGTLPASNAGSNTFNNSAAGAKRGMLFTPPMNCRAIGIRWWNNNANGDFNAVLTGNSGSELSNSSTAFDGDHSALGSNFASTVYFDNAVTLTAGTPYRIAIEPTTATNVNISTVTLPSANYRSASPAGTTALYATYTTAGGWIDTATDQIPLMDLMIDQVDNGSGTGGVVGVIGG